MTTLNGLPNSWESFIQGICSRRKLTKFNRLWEDCTQEEARLEARKEKIENNEDQALTVHTRRGKNKKEFTLTKDFISLIKDKILIKISQASDASFPRRWHILQEIVPKQKTKIKPRSLKHIMPISQEKMNLIKKEQKKMIQMNYIFCDIGLSASEALDSYQVILIAISRFFPH
jgi:hypothetical protein